MAEDSHAQGGRRSRIRHATEGGTLSSAVTFLMLQWSPAFLSGESGPVMKSLLAGALIGILGGLYKWFHESGIEGAITGRIKRAIEGGAAALLLLSLVGCGISLGRVTPASYTGINGETIIACEVVGIQLGIGDGGVCQNVEGGELSDAPVRLVESVGRIAGAIFTPFGALGAALSAPPPPAPAPVRDVPGIVIEPSPPAPEASEPSFIDPGLFR